MNSFKVAYMTDTHLNTQLVTQQRLKNFLGWASYHRVDAVFLGGDNTEVEMKEPINPSLPEDGVAKLYDEVQRSQILIINDHFLPILDEFSQEHPEVSILIGQGNVDTAGYSYLETKTDIPSSIHLTDNNLVKLGKSSFYLISCGGITHYDPWRSFGELTHEEYRDKLDGLSNKIAERGLSSSQVILATHLPPFSTFLDQGRRSYGNPPLLGFIRRHAFPWGLFGHVHESPSKSGKFMQIFQNNKGGTIGINPGGQSYHSYYKESGFMAVIFDLFNRNQLLHSHFGEVNIFRG